jgi:CxxC motif-containing protein (DUF1111 family)
MSKISNLTLSALSSRPLLATLLACALAACGGGDSSSDAGSETPLSWTPPGGSATVAVHATAPFMQLVPNIDAAQMVGVSQGRELFLAAWQPAPGPRALLDGLGPYFNANACSACHAVDGRVAPLADSGATTPAVLFRVGNAAGQEHPVLGAQLQHQATQGLAEGVVTWARDSATGLLRYVVSLFDGSTSMEGYQIGARISPQLVGMGLLDLVPESQLLEYADADDRNGDGVSGRPHWVVEEGVSRIGRFGWKAINATLRTQNAGAMHQDMGLTSPVNPQESCTATQSVCTTAASGGSPEVSEESLMAVVDFMTVLAVPERRVSDQAVFNLGARLFNATGCTACHRPTLTTGTHPRFPSLNHQTLYAYTDLLLHDMGESLSDGVKEKDATAREWRTPPLWGLGIVEQKAGARFLHDGRAATLREAIEWHGGEAQSARDRFGALSENDKTTLLQFLRGI